MGNTEGEGVQEWRGEGERGKDDKRMEYKRKKKSAEKSGFSLLFIYLSIKSKYKLSLKKDRKG